MKLNNKGFTLIELLAVIVLLIAISAIAIPSITASIERSKAKQDDAKKRIIESSAELYYSNNKNKLTNFKNGTCYISIDDLDLTDKEKTDPYNNIYNGGVVYENKKYVYKDANEIKINKCNI